MKPGVVIVALVICFSSTIFGQQAKLEGRVSDDRNIRVTAVRIVGNANWVDGRTPLAQLVLSP